MAVVLDDELKKLLIEELNLGRADGWEPFSYFETKGITTIDDLKLMVEDEEIRKKFPDVWLAKFKKYFKIGQGLMICIWIPFTFWFCCFVSRSLS